MGRKSRLKTVHRAQTQAFMRRLTEPTLKTYVAGGLFFGAAVSALALVRMLFVIGRPGAPGEHEMKVVLSLAIASYFVAGPAAGVGLWYLRGLRQTAGGWAIRGMLVAFCAYGAAAIALAVAYVRFGVNLLDVESPAEAWRAAATMTAGATVVGGIPGGLFYRWRRVS
jgi:hypothetical protein